MPLEQLHEAVGQRRVHQVARREIDRHVHPQSIQAPLRALRDRMREHPLGDRADVPGLLGEWDEFRRLNQSARWMPPAHQRLGVMLAPGSAQGDLGLIGECQLVVVDCLA